MTLHSKKMMKSCAIALVVMAALACFLLLMRMQLQQAKRVDALIAACPIAAPMCALSEVKYSNHVTLTRLDFEVHRCPDGRQATREVSRTVLLSTDAVPTGYLAYRNALALQTGCMVREPRLP
jgi:hypothetical protein